jgi:hypothetical protein
VVGFGVLLFREGINEYVQVLLTEDVVDDLDEISKI